jgi:DNA-binding MarR family transcriptional regulator
VGGFSDVLRDAGDGEGAGAAVEDQNGAALPGLGQGDRKVRGEVNGSSGGGCGLHVFDLSSRSEKVTQYVYIRKLIRSAMLTFMTVELQRLGRAIKQAQYRHHRALDGRLAAIGTTLVQWDALRAIAREPGASAHTLAMATFQSDQAFGTLGNRLLAQGLIDRRPGHGRRIEHHLTAAGERMLAAGHPIANDMLKSSFAPLNQEQRAMLLSLLELMGDVSSKHDSPSGDLHVERKPKRR